jgi:hypothetical protein
MGITFCCVVALAFIFIIGHSIVEDYPRLTMFGYYLIGASVVGYVILLLAVATGYMKFF